MKSKYARSEVGSAALDTITKRLGTDELQLERTRETHARGGGGGGGGDRDYGGFKRIAREERGSSGSAPGTSSWKKISGPGNPFGKLAWQKTNVREGEPDKKDGQTSGIMESFAQNSKQLVVIRYYPSQNDDPKGFEILQQTSGSLAMRVELR